MRNTGLRKTQPPFGVAKAFFTAKTPAVFVDRRCGGIRPITHQMPEAPVALGVARSTLGHPEALWTTLTVRQRAKTTMTLMAPKPQLPQFAPLALEIDMGTGFHPDDERDTQLAEEGKKGHVSKTPNRRHAHGA